MSGAKFCEGCGRRASADARFCGGCGRSFDESADAPIGSSSSVASDVPVADRPVGPPTPAVATTPPPIKVPEVEILSVRPLAVQGIGELTLAVLTLGIAWGILWIARHWTLYRITSQRIEIRTGVFDRRRETIELFRIQDFEVQEPLFLRLRGAGNLVVRSMDAAEAVLVIRAVPGVQEIFESLRSASIIERERHRVRVFEGVD